MRPEEEIFENKIKEQMSLSENESVEEEKRIRNSFEDKQF